jgi:hypothetical protein
MSSIYSNSTGYSISNSIDNDNSIGNDTDNDNNNNYITIPNYRSFMFRLKYQIINGEGEVVLETQGDDGVFSYTGETIDEHLDLIVRSVVPSNTPNVPEYEILFECNNYSDYTEFEIMGDFSEQELNLICLHTKKEVTNKEITFGEFKITFLDVILKQQLSPSS